MNAVDGSLAHVSTCEERSDRFGLLRRRAPERAMAVSAAPPSSDAPLQLLSKFLTRDSAFLEIAATDCSLSLSLADSVRRVYAVARSAVVTGTRRFPANFHLIAAEGNCIPVPQASVSPVPRSKTRSLICWRACWKTVIGPKKSSTHA